MLQMTQKACRKARRCPARSLSVGRALTAGRARAAAVVAAVSALLAAAVCMAPEQAAAVALAADQPSGSRWIAILVIGGTLVVSLGGYIYLKFFSPDDEEPDDE
jgi:hypothetical protein